MRLRRNGRAWRCARLLGWREVSIVRSFDNDRGCHSRPVVVGTAKSEQARTLCNEIDVGGLSGLNKNRSFSFVERLDIPDLDRAEKVGSGKVMTFGSRIEQVQLVRHAVTKPELLWNELVLDHPHLDALGARPVDGGRRVACASNNEGL